MFCHISGLLMGAEVGEPNGNGVIYVKGQLLITSEQGRDSLQNFYADYNADMAGLVGVPRMTPITAAAEVRASSSKFDPTAPPTLSVKLVSLVEAPAATAGKGAKATA